MAEIDQALQFKKVSEGVDFNIVLDPYLKDKYTNKYTNNISIISFVIVYVQVFKSSFCWD